MKTLFAIRDRRDIKAPTKNVLIALVLRADRKGVCYPKMKTVADDAGVSRKTVQRCIAELAASKLVTVERRLHGQGDPDTSLYAIACGVWTERPEVRTARPHRVAEVTVGVGPDSPAGTDGEASKEDILRNQEKTRTAAASISNADESRDIPPEAHAAMREDAELERGTSTPLRQGGAAFEVATTAFAEAVGAVTGSGYGFTPLTRIHFVAAVNAHAPAGLHGRDLEQRIRVSASRFAAERQAKGHAISIQAWLDWLNSGNGWTLAKARPVAVAKARSSAPPREEPPMSLADMAAQAEAALLEIDRRTGVVAVAPLAEGGDVHAS